MSLSDEFREIYKSDQAAPGMVGRTLAFGRHWWQARRRKSQMPRLGQLLLAQGLVNEAQLQHALAEQSRTGTRLGEILLSAGLISRSQLSAALRRQDKVSAAFTALMLSLAHTTAADAESTAGEQMRAASQLTAENMRVAGQAAGKDVAVAMQQRVATRAGAAGREAASEAKAEARALFGEQSKAAGAPGPKVNVNLRQNKPVFDPGELVESLPIHKSFKPRVAEFLPHVHKAAAEFNVPPELILAIIHTESGFRETATTSWKAVGLMQVVARSGGAEAVRYIKGRKGYPSHSALLTPRHNIRLGTAYLRSLEERHFSFIRNDDVRQAAVIAAYNQGPTKIRRMIKKYGVPKNRAGMQALLKKHSVKQTYDYLHRVTKRANIYRPLAQVQVASAR